jgi:hypothetical protein
MMKTSIMIVGMVLLLEHSLFAEMSRVERFHYQKSSHPSHTTIREGSSLALRPHRGSHRLRPHFSHRRRGDHIRHRGISYRYRDGHFYRGLRLVHAPIGAMVMHLPIGYERIRYRDRDFYRYRDVYYQSDRCGAYRVVQNPYYHDSVRYRIGERIRELPLGASAVIIDNVRYYEYGEYYFLPQRRAGVRFYLVVNL